MKDRMKKEETGGKKSKAFSRLQKWSTWDLNETLAMPVAIGIKKLIQEAQEDLKGKTVCYNMILIFLKKLHALKTTH